MSNITAGFDSPVHDAQQVFRKLMEAMSRPGKCVSLDHSTQFGTASSAATQVLLTLADNTTRLWLSRLFSADEALIENVRFHCASPVVAEKSQAAFALIKGDEPESLEGFSFGDEIYPDRSTTLILEVGGFDGGVALSFTGPGIKAPESLFVKGLNSTLLASLMAHRGAFPQGVDILLTAGNDVVAIPRSTELTLMSEEAACM